MMPSIGNQNTAAILEPASRGPRVSGGFIYNRCLSRASRQLGIPLSVETGHSTGQTTLLIDSLWWYYHANPLDLLADELAGRRSWGVLAHGHPPIPKLYEDCARAEFVLVSSEWAAVQLRAKVPTDAIPIQILYPGWDTHGPMWPPIRVDPNEVRFFTSANWHPDKGHLETAAALVRLARLRPDLHWTWRVAGVPHPSLYRRVVQVLGPWAGRLSVLGPIGGPEISGELAVRPICLQPSKQETFSMAVFEAVLAGCPVLTLPVGGVPEAVALAQAIRGQSHKNAVEYLLDSSPDLFAATLLQTVERSLGNWPQADSEEFSEAAAREYSWAGRAQRLADGSGDMPILRQEEVLSA